MTCNHGYSCDAGTPCVLCFEELKDGAAKIQAALGNGCNEDLWHPGTHWVDAAIRAIEHLENHLQC